MPTNFFAFVVLLVASSSSFVVGLESSSDFFVEHSLDSGKTFSQRGRVNFNTFVNDVADEEDARSALERLCASNGLYLLRVGGVKGVADPCGLLHSGLKDVFTLHLDWRDQLVAISSSAEKSVPSSGKAKTFSATRLVVQRMESGPQPDTAAFIQRVEEEKLAKARGETKDNRSFFAKYWMYIIPFVLFLAMSSANPEAQGQGGR